jgi:hypothetical protein
MPEIMVMNERIEQRQPRTLMQAHWELVRIRPSHNAPLAAWLAYYQHSASVYEQIAHTDPTHDGEALYWAQRERSRAQNIAARIRALPPGR